MPENIYMPIEVVEQAKELEGIAAMTPQFYCQTLALGCCEPGEEVRIIGYDSTTDFVVKPYLDENSQGGIGEDDLIVGRNFEDDDLVGYNYMILGRVFKVVSMLQPTGTGMDSTFFMDVKTAQDLCLESEVLRENWTTRDPHDYISVIMIKFADGVDPQAFVKQVEESGMEAKCLLTGETISSLQSQLEVTMQVMFALWLASLLIAVLSLIGRFNALAKERRKEIGLLRAIGLKKGQVFGLIIGETCTMALMGGVLGSGIALLCMNPVITMLKDVSLTVNTGDFIAVEGPSGIGKSTLLYVMGTLLKADEGTYTFEGKDVSRFSDAEKSQFRAKKIGFLFQDSTMIQALTLRENLLFTQGIGGKKDPKKVDELLYQFGLDDRANFFPHQLSGGQRRRAMAARCLIHEPALILADEPTNDLDEHWSTEIIRILREQTQKGTAVVMVTHNSRWAGMATRRLRLEDGSLTDLME